MRIYFFIGFLCLVIGCGQNTPILYQEDPKWAFADDVYDNEIGKPVFLQLRKEKKLHVCESGYGLRGKEKIQVMHCGFFYYSDEINIDEARELLLTTSKLYLKTINQNERIQPFLETFPFGLENIQIEIFLYTSNRQDPMPEKLQVITIKNGFLTYENHSPETKFLTTIYKETYEEALEKMNSRCTAN